MPAAVSKTAGITNQADQLMLPMTDISTLLMLRSTSLPLLYSAVWGKASVEYRVRRAGQKTARQKRRMSRDLAQSVVLMEV